WCNAKMTCPVWRDKFRVTPVHWTQFSGCHFSGTRQSGKNATDTGHRRTVMNESGQATVEDCHPVVAPEPSTAVPRRVREVPTAWGGPRCLPGFRFLDWIRSLEQPFPNYAWNPNSGASVAFAAMFGRRVIPFMFIAPLFDDLIDDLTIRQLPFPLALELG